MDRSERQKGWKKDYGFCGTGLAGEKVGRKGEGQAGRIGYHPEGCELRPGIPPSLFLSFLSPIFFLSPSILFSRPYSSLFYIFVPMTWIRDNAELFYAILIAPALI